MEVRGKLAHKLAVVKGESANGNEWKKQTIVVETEGQYPKKVAIDFFGDKVELLAGLEKDAQLTVSINLESREYKGRWFTNVNGWKLEKGEAKAVEAQAVEHANDDLPF